jgi:HAD superfamily hydrolase (TIGR01490 family)
MQIEMNKENSALAIFDLDKTLLNGDSEEQWCRFLYQRGVVNDQFIDSIQNFYYSYDRGTLDIFAYQAVLLRPLTEIPEETLIKLRNEFLLRVRRMVRISMMKRVNRFRTKGFTLLLITSCNSFLAEPIAQFLHFQNLICTRVRKTDGQMTNELDGTPAFREGKLTLLYDWLEHQNVNLQESWGYSDSHNDIPLLSVVQNPVVVTPDPTLWVYAVNHGWRILKL